MTLDTLQQTIPISVAVQQLRNSPELPRYMQELDALLQTEQKRRLRFYEEMKEDQKVEFINGEVVVHSPARSRHTVVVRNLTILLGTYVSAHQLGYLGMEKVLITLTRNDYEPDVVYFSAEKAQHFVPDQMKFPAPDLVVEVLSPSTAHNDRGVKFQDYAAHGVQEYWIIDPDTEIVEQYVLVNQRYELQMKSATGMLQSVVVADLALPVRAIFDEAEKITAVRMMVA